MEQLMNDFTAKKQAYKTMLDESKKRIEEMMKEYKIEVGFSTRIPADMTVESAKLVVSCIEGLRNTAADLRNQYTKAKKALVDWHIAQLKNVVDSTQKSKRGNKSESRAWVTDLNYISQTDTVYSSLFSEGFWHKSSNVIDALNGHVRKLIETTKEKTAQDEKTKRQVWCGEWLRANGYKNVVAYMSGDAIEQLCIAALKDIQSTLEGLTGEKCYCEDHEDCRHYHFADVYWTGTKYEAYTNSETY